MPKDRRVQLVLPCTRIGDFEIKGQAGVRATQPGNVLMMPMPEGSGVALLVMAFRALVRKTHVALTTDEAVSPDHGLTISIGGPSVNLESRRLLKHHPRFELTYPEHIAKYDGWVYAPERNTEGEITSDYGFLFIRKERSGTKIVCCGVWGAGTEAAIRGLLNNFDGKVAAQLKGPSKVFMAFRTEMSGLQASEPVLLHVDDGERMTQWH